MEGMPNISDFVVSAHFVGRLCMCIAQSIVAHDYFSASSARLLYQFLVRFKILIYS